MTYEELLDLLKNLLILDSEHSYTTSSKMLNIELERKLLYKTKEAQEIFQSDFTEEHKKQKYEEILTSARREIDSLIEINNNLFDIENSKLTLERVNSLIECTIDLEIHNLIIRIKLDFRRKSIEQDDAKDQSILQNFEESILEYIQGSDENKEIFAEISQEEIIALKKLIKQKEEALIKAKDLFQSYSKEIQKIVDTVIEKYLTYIRLTPQQLKKIIIEYLSDDCELINPTIEIEPDLVFFARSQLEDEEEIICNFETQSQLLQQEYITLLNSIETELGIILSTLEDDTITEYTYYLDSTEKIIHQLFDFIENNADIDYLSSLTPSNRESVYYQIETYLNGIFIDESVLDSVDQAIIEYFNHITSRIPRNSLLADQITKLNTLKINLIHFREKYDSKTSEELIENILYFIQNDSDLSILDFIVNDPDSPISLNEIYRQIDLSLHALFTDEEKDIVIDERIANFLALVIGTESNPQSIFAQEYALHQERLANLESFSIDVEGDYFIKYFTDLKNDRNNELKELEKLRSNCYQEMDSIFEILISIIHPTHPDLSETLIRQILIRAFIPEIELIDASMEISESQITRVIELIPYEWLPNINLIFENYLFIQNQITSFLEQYSSEEIEAIINTRRHNLLLHIEKNSDTENEDGKSYSTQRTLYEPDFSDNDLENQSEESDNIDWRNPIYSLAQTWDFEEVAVGAILTATMICSPSKL